ncbi:hypothetical protein [Alkalibacillus haloalkaliphilus]|uniref:hypothetical protein n=1 Tax=Alkalibacillus haloalkaliphilus TaxID=94136 RepID=UPI002936B79E|nr:hypothetical protein [Alkalibacillus haloalkaliphilus]MDV2583151.1 hypothetical protein [Alkalibacillus haloalkaliphilus]
MVHYRYFMGGTTAKGYVNFYENLIEQLDRVVYIEGGFTSIVSPILQRIANRYSDDYAIEYIHNHLMPDQLEGIVIPSLSIGVFDRTKMNQKRLVYPSLYEKLIYLGEGYDTDYLKEHEYELVQYQEEVKRLYTESISHFQIALEHHHRVEKIYIDYLNVRKANKETEDLLKDLLAEHSLNKPGAVKHRYLGAATPQGPIDYVMELTEQLNRRIFIKGRSGTGKSTMLRKLAHEAKDRGFDVEIYHCGFDPGSLDMLILRELSVAIFDATAPHEHDPVKDTDEVLDVYQLFVDGNPDVVHQDRLKKYKGAYKDEMMSARDVLKEIKEHQVKFEKIYKEACAPEFIQEVEDDLLEWIKSVE